MRPFFGYIDQIGDSSKDEEKARYRVRLEADGVVTGWLFLSKEQVKDNVDDYTLDLQTPVWGILWDDNRTGVIGGAINTKKYAQKETDVDIKQFFFKDETYVKYNRNTHVMDVFVKPADGVINIICDGGTLNVKSKNDLKINSVDGKVIINDGNNDGIPILQKVVDNFDKLKQYVDDKLTAVDTGFKAIGAGIASSGTAGSGAFQAASAPIVIQFENMEDEKALH